MRQHADFLNQYKDKMMAPYSVPRALCRAEETIKRSRFIGTVAHTPSPEDAKSFVSQIRGEFSDATHNCWAYTAGPPGSTARIGMSDDGEPRGTAGRPLLNVLLHSGIGEVTVVVTRYFGGTKLGTGGLVRAYSGIAKKVLSALETKEKITPVCLSVIADYSYISALRRMAESFRAKIIKESYGADVSYVFKLPEEKAEAFQISMLDLTNGEIIIESKVSKI